MNQKGFSSIIILLGIAVIVLIGGILGYQKVLSPKVNPASTPTLSPSPTPDPTANWKTYNNKVNNYQIKLPDVWITPTDSEDEAVINSRDEDPKIPGVGKYQVIIASRKLLSGETPDTAVVTYNQIGAQEFNPGGPKPPKSIVKKSTNFLKDYYYVIKANDLRSATIPVPGKNELIFVHILSWPKEQNYSLFDQILSTFKFLD